MKIYTLEEYKRLYDDISEEGAVHGDFFGLPLYYQDGSERPVYKSAMMVLQALQYKIKTMSET